MGRTTIASRPPIVLVLVVGLLGAACGSSGETGSPGAGEQAAASTTLATSTTGSAAAAPDSGQSTTTTLAATTSTTTSTSTTTTTTAGPSRGPVDECSASGLVAPPTPEDLSAEAAITFRAVVDAAVACDFDRLALAAGAEITLSFGGHSEVGSFLEEGDRRDELLRILVGLLAMPAGTIATDVGADISVWPAFWGADEPATAEERATVEVIAGVPYDELVVPDIGYLWYRVGIDADGTWLFFVAGD